VLGLSRRAGESLAIGNDIRIHVVSAHGGIVRLSIEAPSTMRIRRSELRGEPETVKENRSHERDTTEDSHDR
jgi:carbon storage regulator